MIGATPQEKAHLAPFAGFLAVMLLGEIAGKIFAGEPRYWVLPLQTLVGGALLIRYWRYYDLRRPARPLFATLIGAIALIIWIAPQQWFGAASRLDGFQPAFFGATGWPYALNVACRFLRLIIIVPLVEEIFWRGFLLRYFIDDDFTTVPIGAFSWKSFGIVTAGFCLEHQFPDWPAAILTGALFNLVAYRTRSLSACVLTHAITNLLLGLWIMHTGQWGFW
jgi:CAAX prenyl protease-like protein